MGPLRERTAFKLLRGYDPGSRSACSRTICSRRVNVASPDDSLMLPEGV